MSNNSYFRSSIYHCVERSASLTPVYFEDGLLVVDIDSGKINGSGENLKAYFEATTYKREFVKVGTMDFPQKVGDLVQLKKIVSLGGVADLMGVSAYRNKDTDEGECDVDMQIAIKNTSDTFFSRVQVTTKLVDQRDAELADDLSFDALPPHSSKIFTPWLYSLKPGKIKIKS